MDMENIQVEGHLLWLFLTINCHYYLEYEGIFNVENESTDIFSCEMDHPSEKYLILSIASLNHSIYV